jgi:flagellar motor switch protein FliG
MFFAFPVRAQISNPSSYERLRQDSSMVIRKKLEPLLQRYCGEACEIINVDPEIQESLAESEDLGFESTVDEAKNAFYVEKATINIQVDGRVTAQNRELLEKILVNHLQSLGFTTKIDWTTIRLPRIGQSDATIGQLKASLEGKLTRTLQKTIDSYCPEECLISQVAIEGSLITPDQAESLPQTEVIKDGDSLSYMKLERAEVTIELDSSLKAEERSKILNVMRANTRFANPVTIVANVTDFPEPYAQKKEKKAKEADDPYGLEKLRRTLILFRDLAGTKEIVTNSVSSSESSEVAESSSKTSELSQATSTTNREIDERFIKAIPNWVLISAVILILILVGTFAAIKIASANRDARIMMYSADRPRALSYAEGGGEHGGESHGLPAQAAKGIDAPLRLKVDELKAELVDMFIKSPKVAKETFSRMLGEDGVDLTSKYVQIFGHVVVFELLGDPNLSRGLFELSEYFHKSNFNFTPQEELELLTSLKTKVTANEIRLLARRTMDQFDFLLKLDPTQVYNLIIDERSAIQSIVLTQLDHKKRRMVFDLFEGENKVALMQELCRADAIPKEYLSNVALALQKKVLSKPEFDTENLRSADILLDLLEKASLADQRALMANLATTNHDAARALKLKLVTVEMLPYLKDGHLLELVLGLEKEELISFLAGTQNHIRDLLLSKAPEELAESWLEELAAVAGVDEAKFRMVEMKVLGRIRNLANIGAINLIDINEIIFSQSARPGVTGSEQVARRHLVA